MYHWRNKRGNKKNLETNDNENCKIQKLWDAAKAVLKEKFIQSYLKKQEKSQINNLSLHLKQLEKEEQAKLLDFSFWLLFPFLKIELLHDPAIPLLGIYPEKTIIQKDACTLMFTGTLFTIARTWKQPKCPSTEEWIKRCGTYI